MSVQKPLIIFLKYYFLRQMSRDPISEIQFTNHIILYYSILHYLYKRKHISILYFIRFQILL